MIDHRDDPVTFIRTIMPRISMQPWQEAALRHISAGHWRRRGEHPEIEKQKDENRR